MNPTCPASRWDALGAAGSLLCLAHCLLLPLAVPFLPLLAPLASEHWHGPLALILALPVTLAAHAGWRWHRRPGPPVLLGLGLATLVIAAWWLPHAWELPATLTASTLLVVAHGWNWRMLTTYRAGMP
jgi:hypothetical protein